MKTLVLTVGLPHSGKSTWSRKQGFPIVNPDSIRLAIHGYAFIPAAEMLVWTLAQYMVRALFLAGHETVILDSTNITRERRAAWKSPAWELAYVGFAASRELCLARVKAAVPTGWQEIENSSALLEVIDRMYQKFQPVDESDEGIRMYCPEVQPDEG